MALIFFCFCTWYLRAKKQYFGRQYELKQSYSVLFIFVIFQPYWPVWWGVVTLVTSILAPLHKWRDVNPRPAIREAFKATFCCWGKEEGERRRLPTWATQTSTTTLVSTHSEVTAPPTNQNRAMNCMKTSWRALEAEQSNWERKVVFVAHLRKTR